MKTKITQKVISMIRVDFDSIVEKELDVQKVSECMQVFSGYRKDWKSYGKSKESGQKVIAPNFPFPAIRVHEVAGWYFPMSPDDKAVTLAARKSKINRIVVAVEEQVCENMPIHPNDFFACFKIALRSLQATDLQRVEFFKPLLRAMLNEGFTDKSRRAEFMDWAKKEFDRHKT